MISPPIQELTRLLPSALAGGAIDILVNNSGVLPFAAWMEATAEIWEQTYNVNVISGVRMIQRLVPQMRERHWGG